MMQIPVELYRAHFIWSPACINIPPHGQLHKWQHHHKS